MAKNIRFKIKKIRAEGGRVCCKKGRFLQIMLSISHITNVGFSRCIYVQGIALADVITYIERHFYLF